MIIKLSEGQRQIVKHGFYVVFTVGITLWIFTYLFSVILIDDVVNAIKTSSHYYLTLFFLFSMIMSIGRTWRYMLFLNASGQKPRHLAMFLVTLARNFFSDLLPARIGTLVYIYLTQTRLGISFDAAASSFALAFVFDILVLLIMVIGTSIFISSAVFSSVTMITVAVFTLIICLIILWRLQNGLQWLGQSISRFPVGPIKFREKCKEALWATGAEINHIKSKNIYSRAIALSLVVRLGKYMSLYALLLAIVIPLGYAAADFPFRKVFLGMCGAELSASLPISGIAGFGAYEGTWVLVFQVLGYSRHLSALTSVTHHLISQIYGYLLGAAALLTLLLPYFKNKSQRSIQPDSNKLWGFWLRYLVLLFAIGILLLVTIISPYAQKQSAVGKSQDLIADSTPAFSTTLPKGRVVYMRDDGIYVKELQSHTGKRILKQASYPRWSPDGKKIAFVHGHRIGMIHLASGVKTYLAKAEDPHTVAFGDAGNSIYFSDGKTIFTVDINSRQKQKVAQGKTYRELDVAGRGTLLAVTAKEVFGYYVYAIDLKNNHIQRIARGCSASLSPDGRQVTVNDRSHKALRLFDRLTGKKNMIIDAPAGIKFDNQFWSNDPDWIVSISEGETSNIYVHQISSNQSWQVTKNGNCNRPDLYVDRQ